MMKCMDMPIRARAARLPTRTTSPNQCDFIASITQQAECAAALVDQHRDYISGPISMAASDVVCICTRRRAATAVAEARAVVIDAPTMPLRA